MTTVTRYLMVLACGLGLALTAVAQEWEGLWPRKTLPKSFYIGGGFGPARIDLGNKSRNVDGVDFNLADKDGGDLASRFVLGYWITDHFGVELDNVNYGKVTQPFTYSDARNGDTGPGEVDVDISGMSFSFIGSCDVGDFCLFARVGQMYWSQDMEVRFDHPGEEEYYHTDNLTIDGTSLVYGGGVAWNFGPGFWLRCEADITQMDDDTFTTITTAVVYDFGALARAWEYR